MNALIDARGLSRAYPMGAGQVQALRGVDLEVQAGEFVALMGPSGSGKSTLLHLLGCLDRPTAGAYCLAGADVSRLSDDERARIRGRQIGFVFQSFNLLPRFNAIENVALPLFYGGDTQDWQARAAKALQRVGLVKRAQHRPAELSGGERQRVAIARALVSQPALILADEPTGNLDSRTGQEIMDLLAELPAEGRTLVMVTHDRQIAASAGRIVTMRDGRIQGEERL